MKSFPVLLSVVGAWMLTGCATEPAPISDTPSNPASPHAAETPVIMMSHTLDPSVSAGEMGPSNGNAGNVASAASHPISQPATTQAAFYYTCVMNPEIHQDHPGTCPICGMTLVKKDVVQASEKGEGK